MASQNRQDDESQPLLQTPNQGEPTPRQRGRPGLLIAVACVMVSLSIAEFLEIAAMTKVFQDTACAEYYRHHSNSSSVPDLDEEKCKIGPVMREVAFVAGWQATIEQLPGKI